LTSNQRNWAVFFGAIAVTGLVGGVFLGAAGSSDENLQFVLRLTARSAFLVLLVIFVARPLRQMFRTPLTSALLRNRRLLGIGFAGIHVAHLGFIIYRARVIDTFEFTIGANLPGALTYGMLLLMFLTSFDATVKMLGPKSWRRLHKLGLYWLLIAFTQTQLPESLDHADQMQAANWAILGLVGMALVIRLTAHLAQRQRSAMT